MKSKTNRKRAHGYRKQTDGCQKRYNKGVGKMGEGL